MKKTAILMNIATVIGLPLTLVFLMYCLKIGLFALQTKLNEILRKFGIYDNNIYDLEFLT